MGWLAMTSLGVYHTPREYLDAQLESDRPERQQHVLRSALVHMRTYYAAVEMLEPNKPREVIAVICLVHYNPRAKDGYVFWYKDMDESAGPCEAECPAAILDLLTPTTYEYALEWRVKCRAYTARRAATPKLHDGDTLILDEPMAFTNGTSQQRFTVVLSRLYSRRMRFRSEDEEFYRITNLRNRSFTVTQASPLT